MIVFYQSINIFLQESETDYKYYWYFLNHNRPVLRLADQKYNDAINYLLVHKTYLNSL